MDDELCLTNAVFFFSPEAQEKLWTELKAAAESGWDFSSRWYINNLGQNSGSFKDTSTSAIVPVDLNALICRNEHVLATFHRILGEHWQASTNLYTVWGLAFFPKTKAHIYVTIKQYHTYCCVVILNIGTAVIWWQVVTSVPIFSRILWL